MKHSLIFLTIISALILPARAQMKDPSFSFAVMPVIGNRIITYKQDYSAKYKDSIKKGDIWRDAISASVMMGFRGGSRTRFHIGLQFHNFGFTRRKENIRFLDTIHPQIGIMQDLSQTGNNYVDFNFRYMYLSIPFLVSTQISGKSMKSSTLHFVFGGSVSGLLKHDIRAQFHGFSARGKKIFKLDDSESEAGLLNGNAHVGLRLENLVYGKSTFVFLQPTVFMPLLSANYGPQRHHLYALGLEVGLMYKPSKDKKE